MAMQGLLAGRDKEVIVNPYYIADEAVQCADELIKALNQD
jgi:hypothetical protein